MSGDRANVYVDGFNLYYGALKGRGPGFKWLDLAALSRRLLPRYEIGRIRYFTALVSDRPHAPGVARRQLTYLRALETSAEVTIHLGVFKITYPWMALHPGPAGGSTPATMARVIKTEEKGSDVNLATYLVLDACRRDCEVAVVITNDSDLREPIRVVGQELGVRVGVVNPRPARHRNQVFQASFIRQLRAESVLRSQFPAVLTDATGRSIRRPAGW